MIRKCTTVLLLSALATLFAVRTNAQGKIAYINMQQLITSMPEAKRAFDTLQLYQQELTKDGQALVDEFNVKLQKFKDESEKLSQNMLEARTKELEAAQKNIEEYKARMEQKLAMREQELTTPIVSKAKKTVSDLATEKGFVCVLDSSKEIIVVATCEDLLPAAKAKLGIK